MWLRRWRDRRRRLAKVLWDAQLVHLAVQARHADAQVPRRLILVVVVAAEAVEDVLPLELLERVLEVLAGVVADAFDRERQVLDRDLPPFREDDGPLDDILQLSNV